MQRIFSSLALTALLLITVQGGTTPPPPPPINPKPPTHATDFIPCSDPCNGGDVNYELVTSVRTFPLMNYTYRGRTYSTPDSDSFMGPTLRVQPGQSLWIKLRNDMHDTSSIGPKDPTARDYWNMLQNPGEYGNNTNDDDDDERFREGPFTHAPFFLVFIRQANTLNTNTTPNLLPIGPI